MRLRIGRLPISNYIINKNEDSEKSHRYTPVWSIGGNSLSEKRHMGENNPLLLNTDPKTDEELLGRTQE